MKQNINKVFKFIYDDMLLPILCLVLFILAFCFEPITEVFNGYKQILFSTSILVTDYIAIGGLGATFLNVASILLFNIVVFKFMRIEMNGPIFSGFLMILGFSFFGKNLVNTLPIYLGIYLYSKCKKMHFKNFIIATLFSTGISPLVSYTMFSFAPYIGIPLGILVGIVVGFLIPTISSHTVLFHKGYNLFNTGFALGIISVLFYALYKGLGFDVKTVYYINNDYHNTLLILFISICLFSILVSFVKEKKVISKYLKILNKSGRLVTDFIKEDGREVVFFNFGLLGIVTLIFILLFDIQLNGVTFGSVISVISFASYGMHIKNTLPVWLGAILGVYCLGGEYFTSVNTAICFFFCVGLAPIAGKYGVIYGMIAGFLHIMITPLMIGFQGGFDLYNNGFSAGFVAFIVVNIKEALTFKDEEF